MKALVFDKSKYDWETLKDFELVDIPELVLDLTDFLLLGMLFLVNLTAFSPARAGRQFLF